MQLAVVSQCDDKEPNLAFKLDKQVLDAWLKIPEVHQAVQRVVERVRLYCKPMSLQQVWLYSHLNHAAAEQLASFSAVKVANWNSPCFNEKNINDVGSAFLVLCGNVRVLTEVDGELMSFEAKPGTLLNAHAIADKDCNFNLRSATPQDGKRAVVLQTRKFYFQKVMESADGREGAATLERILFNWSEMVTKNNFVKILGVDKALARRMMIAAHFCIRVLRDGNDMEDSQLGNLSFKVDIEAALQRKKDRDRALGGKTKRARRLEDQPQNLLHQLRRTCTINAPTHLEV